MKSQPIPAQDIQEGDVIIEDGAEYVVSDVFDSWRAVYVQASRDDVAGDDEFEFQHDESVQIKVQS